MSNRKNKVVIDDNAIAEVFAGIDGKIDNIDRIIRAESAGRSLEQIRARAIATFESFGISVMDPEFGGYIQAVADGKPFKIRLH